MMPRAQRAPFDAVTVKRIGSGVWILRLRHALAGGAVPALRDAFGEAIERDANDVVVDLGTNDAVSSEGAALLAAMADLMRNRHGSLWIAAAWADGTRFTLQPIHEAAPAGLIGITPALDRALETAGASDVELGPPDRRHVPAIA